MGAGVAEGIAAAVTEGSWEVGETLNSSIWLLPSCGTGAARVGRRKAVRIKKEVGICMVFAIEGFLRSVI